MFHKAHAIAFPSSRGASARFFRLYLHSQLRRKRSRRKCSRRKRSRKRSSHKRSRRKRSRRERS